MLIDAVEIQGLRMANDWSQAGLAAPVALPAAPQGVAVADALSMVEAVLNPDRFVAVAQGLGLLKPEHEIFLDDAHFVEQAVALDIQGVDAMLADAGNRRVTVSITIKLDPPLYGRLREESHKDPRVMTALGQDGTLTLKVGWLFSMSREAVSLGVLEARVGDTAFALNKSDRPSWMNGMLRAIGERLGRMDWAEPVAAVTQRLQRASVSADPNQRAGFGRAAVALAEPPFSLGRLELSGLGADVVAAFGPDLVRARSLGPAASRALRLVESALLRAPDVLVVEDATAAEADWLMTCLEGDNATLEQVWILGDPT